MDAHCTLQTHCSKSIQHVCVVLICTLYCPRRVLGAEGAECRPSQSGASVAVVTAHDLQPAT